MKSTTDDHPAYRQTFLETNSGRLGHPSRGFSRDGRVIPGGIDGVTTLLNQRSPDTQPVRAERLVGA